MKIKKTICFLFICIVAFQPVLQSQSTSKDTIYTSTKDIWKVESKRGEKKFGISRLYRKYYSSQTNIVDKYLFYVEGKLNGFEVLFDNWGAVTSMTNYRNNIPTYGRTSLAYGNGKVRETFYPSTKVELIYNKHNTLESINYPDLKEKISFYPDKTVKSIILTDSSKNEISRKYYEFSKEGVLIIEGIYADSFFEKRDTVSIFNDSFDENVVVFVTKTPLRNGVWYYYNDKGILQEKKVFKYYAE
jgi:hypothetical protein